MSLETAHLAHNVPDWLHLMHLDKVLLEYLGKFSLVKWDFRADFINWRQYKRLDFRVIVFSTGNCDNWETNLVHNILVMIQNQMPTTACHWNYTNYQLPYLFRRAWVRALGAHEVAAYLTLDIVDWDLAWLWDFDLLLCLVHVLEVDLKSIFRRCCVRAARTTQFWQVL